jgi:colanic acid/amylovoran biosynthesis protein
MYPLRQMQQILRRATLHPAAAQYYENPFEGKILKAFLAKSNDAALFMNGESGGIASALSAYILEHQKASGVLSTCMSNDGTFQPYSKIVRDTNELAASQHSKYVPVAWGLGLKTLQPAEKIAAVGLPCQFHSLFNAEQNNVWNDAVVYKIGLICDRTLSAAIIDRIFQLAGLKREDCLEFHTQRKKASTQPVSGYALLRNGKRVELPNRFRLHNKDAFTPFCCRLCFDKMNVLADVVCGDTWGIDHRNDGFSLLIAHTERGLHLIEEASHAGAIEVLQEVERHRVLTSCSVAKRRTDWSVFTRLVASQGNPVPDFHIENDCFYPVTAAHLIRIKRSKFLQEVSTRQDLLTTADDFNAALQKAGKRPLNFLLTGIGFHNKGAELMLYAMLEHFRQRFPGVHIAVRCKTRLRQRNDNQLFIESHKGIFSQQKYPKFLSWLMPVFRLLPQKVRQKLGMILLEEFDAVIDASGFSFGDQWGTAVKVQETFQCCKKTGSKIILLPQSFGPFNQIDVKECSQKVFQYCDLIFARELQSLEYIEPLTDKNKLRLAPDFTVLVKGILPDTFPDSLHNAVGIMPNQKLLSKKANEESRRYYAAMLSRCVDVLLQRGIPLFFLCHQAADRQVIAAIKKHRRYDFPVLEENNARNIKAITGTCRFVIGSRYHGLVNALTQGVPVIAAGWSHKYHALLQEYGMDKYLICDMSDTSQIEDQINELSNPSNRQAISQKILEHVTEVRRQTEQMWKSVDAVILSDM